MPFEGCVNLKNPDIQVMYLEYYGLDQNKIPQMPYDVFICRFVSIFDFIISQVIYHRSETE